MLQRESSLDLNLNNFELEDEKCSGYFDLAHEIHQKFNFNGSITISIRSRTRYSDSTRLN